MRQYRCSVWRYWRSVLRCQCPAWSFQRYVGNCSICITPQMCNSHYGFFFLGSNVHLWHICMANGPSVTTRQIFAFVIFLINLYGVSYKSQVQFKWNFLCTLWILDSRVCFLLSHEVWNMCVLINLTSYTSSKLAESSRTLKYSSTSAAWQCAVLKNKQLSVWDFGLLELYGWNNN